MNLKVILKALWDRILGWALIACGLIAILIGWIGVSGTPFVYKQLPYVVSGGLLGIALIGIGATLLISADLRDEWRKLEQSEARF